MATGTLTNETVDEFPTTTRVGAPAGPRETDVDIALKAYKDAGAQGVLKFLDYNVENETDEAGNVVGTKPVDEKTARGRASGRTATLKSRGYTIEDGWVIVARNGAVYAKYFGPGNVPPEYTKAGKAVGEAVPV